MKARTLGSITLVCLAALLLIREHSLLLGHGGASNDYFPLTKIADVPLPGPAVRFDYQSIDLHQRAPLDRAHERKSAVVFDVKAQTAVANLDGFARVQGVLAVPELGRVYASVTGDHEVAAVDMKTLKTVAKKGWSGRKDLNLRPPGPEFGKGH
jgi:hypothetical protein